MGSFAVSMQAWCAKATANMHQVVKQTVVGVVAGVDARSPVGNRELWAVNIDRASRGLPPVPKNYSGGRFRGNNQLAVDDQPAGVLDRIDPSGSETVAENISRIPVEAGGHMYWLVNNLPYARPLEDGHSTQAPAGIYGLTAMEWQQIVDAAVANLQK